MGYREKTQIIWVGGVCRAKYEPQNLTDSIADFFFNNNEKLYFRIEPNRTYFNHTLYYFLRKQKPESTA